MTPEPQSNDAPESAIGIPLAQVPVEIRPAVTALAARLQTARAERDEARAALAEITPLKNKDIRLVISLTKEVNDRCAERDAALAQADALRQQFAEVEQSNREHSDGQDYAILRLEQQADALRQRVDRLEGAAQLVIDWHAWDGSVGGRDKVLGELLTALAQPAPAAPTP